MQVGMLTDERAEIQSHMPRMHDRGIYHVILCCALKFKTIYEEGKAKRRREGASLT
jgi:hypothetical protein